MDFQAFVSWCFYGLIGGCAVYGVAILAKMNESIQDLNVKIAVVIEKTGSHEKRLDKHDDLFENMKKNRGQNVC